MLAKKVALFEVIFQSIVVKVILEENALSFTEMTSVMDNGHVPEELVVRIEATIAEFAEGMALDDAFRVIGITVFHVFLEFFASIEFLLWEEHFPRLHAQITVKQAMNIAQML